MFLLFSVGGGDVELSVNVSGLNPWGFFYFKKKTKRPNKKNHPPQKKTLYRKQLLILERQATALVLVQTCLANPRLYLVSLLFCEERWGNALRALPRPWTKAGKQMQP